MVDHDAVVAPPYQFFSVLKMPAPSNLQMAKAVVAAHSTLIPSTARLAVSFEEQ